MPSTLTTKTHSKPPAANPDHLLPRQTREAIITKLRTFCASLERRELKVMRKHYPQLPSPKN